MYTIYNLDLLLYVGYEDEWVFHAQLHSSKGFASFDKAYEFLNSHVKQKYPQYSFHIKKV